MYLINDVMLADARDQTVCDDFKIMLQMIS
jgi:hypothetical protein